VAQTCGSTYPFFDSADAVRVAGVEEWAGVLLIQKTATTTAENTTRPTHTSGLSFDFHFEVMDIPDLLLLAHRAGNALLIVHVRLRDGASS
jgi:hypothetical protein